MVNFTLDALAFDHELLIAREVVLDIHLCLAARPGIRLDDVKEILSIPVATAQCHRYLREFLPDAEVRSAASTAAAAQLVSEDPAPHLAAIAPRDRGRALRTRGARREHRGPRREPDAVRARAPVRHPGSDRPRPHGARRVPARRRAGQPDLDPAGVRRPPAQPLEPDLAADQARRPRRLLLHHLRRRPHRRRPRRRRHASPARQAGCGQVLRIVAACRSPRPRRQGPRRRALATRRRLGRRPARRVSEQGSVRSRG